MFYLVPYSILYFFNLSWNENTYDDVYPFSSTRTGSHFGGAVFKDKTNYYLAGGYRYSNISSTEILEYNEAGKYQKRTVHVQLNPIVNSPNSSANSLPSIPLKIRKTQIPHGAPILTKLTTTVTFLMTTYHWRDMQVLQPNQVTFPLILE